MLPNQSSSNSVHSPCARQQVLSEHRDGLRRAFSAPGSAALRPLACFEAAALLRAFQFPAISLDPGALGVPGVPFSVQLAESPLYFVPRVDVAGI
jgi:hypothetical protein